MRTDHRQRIFAAAIALVTGTTTLITTDAATTAAPPAPLASTGSITLVTGDLVTIQPGGVITIKPAKGREKISFVSRSDAGHRYVIPADAAQPLSAGIVDARLFDVKTLLAQGYGDGRRSDLPLILQYDRAKRPALAGAAATRELPALGMTAIRTNKSATFWASAGRKAALRIWLDGKRKIDLDQSVPQIGAPTAWAAGYTGKGVTTAILDTGVDATHPDLAGKIVQSQDFTGGNDTDDKVGHGTHIASTITGSGAASGGKYKGVAPDTTLAIGKVCADENCDDSAILAGMTWAAQTVRAKVVNLSLGSADTPDIDPLELAVNDLSRTNGTLFVIAAGNHPSGSDLVSSPGSADAALTVGAVDKKDQLAGFSNHGPRVADDALKPDIAAPGVNIVAAKATNGSIGDPSDNPRYVSLSGTSMATPHVAGAAAVLASQHPDWTGSQLKAALMASAKSLPDIGMFFQGAGRVDLGKAITQDLTSTPPSVSIPTARWPHTHDKPVARTLSYHNSGKSALTLTVSLTVNGSDGRPAPVGMFTASASSLSVPANGDAALTVTTNASVSGGTDGEFVGSVNAIAAGQSLRTPIAFNREPESYNLTVRNIDRSGKPTASAYARIANYDTPTQDDRDISDYDGDGTATIRLPKGRYALSDVIFEVRGQTLSMIAAPLLNLDQDTTIDADARKARPFDITVDNPAASEVFTTVSSWAHTRGGEIGSSIFGGPGGSFVLNVGKPAPASLFSAILSSLWAKTASDGSPDGSPFLYHLAQPVSGQLPGGIPLHAKTAELAAVRTTSSAPGGAGTVERMAVAKGLDGWNLAGLNTSVGAPAPGTVTEYLTPDVVTWWRSSFLGAGGSDHLIQGTQPTLYHRRGYADNFNKGVFGPGFRHTLHSYEGRVAQYPDQLSAGLQLLSDNDLTHSGMPAYAYAGTSTLFRDGVKVAESDDSRALSYEAPAARASYRLDAQLTQNFMAESTKVSASWTFRSEPTTNPFGESLPLFALRFTPALDDDNAAPAGRTLLLPVSVDRQDGAAKATVHSPVIEYSTDDGHIWKKATVAPASDGRWVALVSNPAAGFVSLRASATDSAGNTSTETIVRAYAVR